MLGGKEPLSHYAPYGATTRLDLGLVKRRPINYISPFLAFLAPWTMFCFIFGVLTFPIHFNMDRLVAVYVVASLFLILCIGVWAWVEGEARRRQTFTNPTWCPFLFVCLLFAWIVGLILGSINYAVLMKPYMQIMTMNNYQDVDPLLMRGGQLQDAGLVRFVNNSKIDISKAMGFRNYDMYCVAPISVEGPSQASDPLAPGLLNQGVATTELDFWVVGKNCCNEHGRGINCQGFDVGGLSGMRLTDDSDRAFYRLAVQEAEALYGIRANHPIFFNWVRDPMRGINEGKEHAFRNYLRGVLAYGVFQLFVVVYSVILLAQKP